MNYIRSVYAQCIIRDSGAHLAAGCKILALGNDALVVIDVVLPAVLGLVLVGKAGVEACRAPELVSISHQVPACGGKKGRAVQGGSQGARGGVPAVKREISSQFHAHWARGRAHQ